MATVVRLLPTSVIKNGTLTKSSVIISRISPIIDLNSLYLVISR